jgi:hypothetical protein
MPTRQQNTAPSTSAIAAAAKVEGGEALYPAPAPGQQHVYLLVA